MRLKIKSFQRVAGYDAVIKRSTDYFLVRSDGFSRRTAKAVTTNWQDYNMTQRDYKAYLLRLWREKAGTPWRAALENPNSSERIAFATLVELVAFIEEMTGEQIRATPSEPTSAPFKKE